MTIHTESQIALEPSLKKAPFNLLDIPIFRTGKSVGLAFHHAAFQQPVVSPRTLLTATGNDARRFLHNRTSHDVNALQPNQGQLNTVLDKSAKIQGVFTLHALPNNTFVMITHTDTTEQTLAELLRFKILDDVTISETNRACLSLHGVQAHEVFDLTQPSTNETATLATLPPYGIWEGMLLNTPVTIVKYAELGEPAYQVWLEPEAAVDFKDALINAYTQGNITLGLIDANTWNTLRVEAGLPEPNTDYTTDTLLPETGLEQEAVSYTKGCYLGQETIARVKTYGAVPKALVGLVSDTELPVGDIALAETPDKTIGRITSSTFSPTLNKNIALTYLNKTSRTPNVQLNLIATKTNTPITATVSLLPFVTSTQQSDKAAALLKSGLTAFALSSGESDDDQAIRDLRQALTLDNTLADAYEALGAILSRREQYDEAIALMHTLVNLDPERIMAHTNLSVYTMKIGDKETAEKHKATATALAFKQAMTNKMTNKMTNQMTKKMTETNAKKPPEQLADEQVKQNEAIQKKLHNRAQMFKDALQYSPDDPLGNFGLGSIYLELGNFNEAITVLEKTVNRPTSQSSAYEKLGQAYEGAQRLDDAIAIYTQGIDVASTRRDLMPLNAMQAKLNELTKDETS